MAKNRAKVNGFSKCITTQFADGTADAIVRGNGRTTFFYKLPMVYQQYSPAAHLQLRDESGAQFAAESVPQRYGIFYATFRRDDNANLDFPWEGTLGLNQAIRDNHVPSLYGTVNFLSLPHKDEGPDGARPWPVLVIWGERPVRWIFPTGTVAGEVLYVQHEGKKYVQEVRMRTKAEDSSTWEPSIYRPIMDQEELEPF